MPVRFFYIDESHDEHKFCLSAIMVRHTHWLNCFQEIRAHREMLKREHGIFLRKEIHARELVSGRGRISPKVIGKWVRSRIFLGFLQLVARLPDVLLFNVCLDKKGTPDPQLKAWDRMVNRIERTMLECDNKETSGRGKVLNSIQNLIPETDYEYVKRRLTVYQSRAFLIADEGREHEITRALRKMRVFNPVPSQFGSWPSGNRTHNITAQRIIEDPVFKPSHRSYFIQLADCVAFALLKREVPPTGHVEKYGIHKMFDDVLAGVCFTKACRKDKLGIVRG